MGNIGENYKCKIADRWGFEIGIASDIMLDIKACL